jgi:hypothetical protein
VCARECECGSRQNQQIAKSIRGNGEEENEASAVLFAQIAYTLATNNFRRPAAIIARRRCCKNVHAAVCLKVLPTRVYNKNERRATAGGSSLREAIFSRRLRPSCVLCTYGGERAPPY